MTRWVWDAEKAASNLQKHGIGFEAAVLALEDPFSSSVDDPHPDMNRLRTTAVSRVNPHVMYRGAVRLSGASSACAVRHGLNGGLMKTSGNGAVSPEVIAQLKALEAMREEDIGLSDMPEVTDWSGAVRGRFSSQGKRTVSISLDADLVAYVEASGTMSLSERLNELLQDWVAQTRLAAE